MQQGKDMIQIQQQITEKAYLVGVISGNREKITEYDNEKVASDDIERSMKELEALAQAADMEVVGDTIQKLEVVNKALYIGPGKVEEVKGAASLLHAAIIIFNDSLSPTQLRNLQKEIGLPVMDRSSLILEIFSSRARTREAKLQVEVARLQYMLPRLIGLHDALSRQGGASGAMSNKGAGETKLELDRRRLEHRLTELKRELKSVSEERKTQRKKRSASGKARIALVGYTNAGKSTLMNVLLEEYGGSDREIAEKKVFEKDMLFATLDTAVREIIPPDHHAFLLSDTVGFVDKLPHILIDAFHATLEEAAEADLLLLVVDYSDPHAQEQIRVTKDTLRVLGADKIPLLILYNKADIVREEEELPIIKQIEADRYCIYMSAKKKIGLLELLDLIEKMMANGYAECCFFFPYTEGSAISYLNEHAIIRKTEYLPDGIEIQAHCTNADQARFAKFIRKE